jgi:hypothetical protein
MAGEGCGRTIAYWHENLARLGNPAPWTVQDRLVGRAGGERVGSAALSDGDATAVSATKGRGSRRILTFHETEILEDHAEIPD